MVCFYLQAKAHSSNVAAASNASGRAGESRSSADSDAVRRASSTGSVSSPSLTNSRIAGRFCRFPSVHIEVALYECE